MTDRSAPSRILLVAHAPTSTATHRRLLRTGLALRSTHGARIVFLLVGAETTGPGFALAGPTLFAADHEAMHRTVAAVMADGLCGAIVDAIGATARHLDAAGVATVALGTEPAQALLAALRPGRPLPSVIVTTRNQARMLPTRLGAAFARPGPVAEVLVLDQGSTDDSIAVARSVARDWQRTIRVESCPPETTVASYAAGLACGTHLWIAGQRAAIPLAQGALRPWRGSVRPMPSRAPASP